MICSNCGKDVESGMRFCAECGHQMPAESAMGGLQYNPPAPTPPTASVEPTTPPPTTKSFGEAPPLTFNMNMDNTNNTNSPTLDQPTPVTPPTTDNLMNQFVGDADLGSMAEPSPFNKDQRFVTNESVYEPLSTPRSYENERPPQNNRSLVAVAIIVASFCLIALVFLLFYPKIVKAFTTPSQYYISQEYVALKNVIDSYRGNLLTATEDGTVESKTTLTVESLPAGAEALATLLGTFEINTKSEYIAKERYARSIVDVLMAGSSVANVTFDINETHTAMSFPGIAEGMVVSPVGLNSASTRPTEMIRDMCGISEDDFSMLAQKLFKESFIDVFPASEVTETKGVFMDKSCDMVTFDFNKTSLTAMRDGFAQYLETNRDQLIPVWSNILKYYEESAISSVDEPGDAININSDIASVTEQYDAMLAELKATEIAETSTLYTVYYNSKGRVISRSVEIDPTTGDNVAFSTYEQDDMQVAEFVATVGADIERVTFKNKSDRDSFKGTMDVTMSGMSSLTVHGSYDFAQKRGGAIPMLVGNAKLDLTLGGMNCGMNMVTENTAKDTYKSTLGLTLDDGQSPVGMTFNVDTTTSSEVTVQKIDVPEKTTITPDGLKTVMESVMNKAMQAVMMPSLS